MGKHYISLDGFKILFKIEMSKHPELNNDQLYDLVEDQICKKFKVDNFDDIEIIGTKDQCAAFAKFCDNL